MLNRSSADPRGCLQPLQIGAEAPRLLYRIKLSMRPFGILLEKELAKRANYFVRSVIQSSLKRSIFRRIRSQNVGTVPTPAQCYPGLFKGHFVHVRNSLVYAMPLLSAGGLLRDCCDSVERQIEQQTY